MSETDWIYFQPYISQLEQEGKVTRTFRRLDPERQQAIFDAIMEEATEKGPASLNIKEIARRAGVSVGSLYQYFPDRDGLLDFAVELCTRATIAMFKEYTPMMAAMPLKDAMQAYLMGGLEWGQTAMGLVRFFGRAAYQGDPDLAERVVRPVATVMREAMQEILAQAQARGEIRPEVDIVAATRVMNALMIAIGDSQLLPYLNTYFQVTDKKVSLERVSQALLDLIQQGIATEAK
ncbi:MAG TPA: TetR/AcrR family transcriptional regulator [Anaerolineales bacterium]|nr:TetR/AcrR family transcriptional regulator [Anaerolineales bacterium]